MDENNPWVLSDPIKKSIGDIKIPMDLVTKFKLNINEYLILYSLSSVDISSMYEYEFKHLCSLEEKGYIKVTIDGIFLRKKVEEIFPRDNTDYFAEWIDHYPTSVKKKTGGTRTLSPADPDTVLGKKLRAKWNKHFGKDYNLQRKVVKILEAEVNDKKRSGDLEYMVNAERWLNGGYWELNEHLIESSIRNDRYLDEDYY